MNPRDRLQYALYLQRLQELFVIKENIAFEYQHANYNQAAAQIDKAVDKMLQDNVVNIVDGTTSLEKPNLDYVITEALSKQQNMLIKTPDRYIQNAVEQNTRQFTNILQNRIEKENHSLQRKIEEEYRKKKYNNLSEEEAKKILTEKFQDHGRRRAKNIVKDALHTNQSHMSWVSNRDLYKYKVWMNGQGKGKVRSWHISRKIYPVEIDDFFDIFGPKGHAQMMYPGDLYGGAENVANCKCWLRYTNIAPSNLKKKGTIQVNPNVQLENENSTTFSANTEKTGLFTKIKDKLSEIRNRIAPNSEDSTLVEDRSSNTKWNKDPNKVVEINGKKVYGVGETKEDKIAFKEEYGIKEKDLTKQELSFVQLYSDEGFKILNPYLREIAGIKNPIKKLRIKRTYSKLWHDKFKDFDEYITFSRALTVSNAVFNKGKPLKEDIVVVRRQKSPMSKYANEDIYTSDSYLSTSISENVKPEEYGHYINYIVIPEGTKILYIEEVTLSEGEFEVLLDKGTKLQMIDEKSELLVHWGVI